MPENSVKRKLTAILCADVKGYSRMMGEDEVGTYQTLTANLESIHSIISEHNGRVFSSPGDAVMAEFASVVDAVQCAVKLQENIEAANAELPEDRKMQFRIGVNLGDVIYDGEQVYGDGVNIAARIETLAEPGKVAISKNVYRNIRNKLKFGYEYQGEHQVKNIADPVRVYKVLTEPEYAGKLIGEPKAPKLKSKNPAVAIFVVLAIVVVSVIWHFYPRPPKIEPASVENMAYPLPDKSSIAVLPFDNMSGDPDQEYLADGITENIITALSNVHNMFVIARNSTFAYKGKSVKVQQVAEELGIRYVLEGSIQKTEDRVRITAQLIDAITGKHLWAERYDSDLKDLFDLQDEITIKIIAALRVKLTEGERANLSPSGTDNLSAYLKLMQAAKQRRRWNKEGNALSHKLSEEAIALDPEYAEAYLDLSANHLMDMMYGASESPKQSLKKAEELVQKAISLRGEYADALAFLGRIYLTKKQYDLAIEEGERAVVLAPNSSFVHAALAFSLGYAGRPEEAIPYYKKAIRLSPIADTWYLSGLGACYRMMGRYEEAISTFKKAISFAPNGINYHAGQAANYALAGRMDEAQAEAAKVLRIDHKFSLESFRKGQLYKDQAYLDKLISVMRKAGLPDKPPLPLPDKPSIAVLSFENMSNDPEQEYFSDGLTEEIITALSKSSNLFVIARNSSFTYKNKPVKLQQVGRELGVKYVLEGSVRKVDDKLRITAQLIEASTGHHLWAERYDRDLKDIFAIQDDITKQVIAALHVKLTIGGDAGIIARNTKSLDAYLKYLQAREHHMRLSKEENHISRRLLEEVISIDPEYGTAYTLLGATHMLDVWLQATDSPKKSLDKAIELQQKAIALGDNAHGVLGFIYSMIGQHEKATAECQQAVEIDPNSSTARTFYGIILNMTGRSEEAVEQLEKGVRLDPFSSSFSLRSLALAYCNVGRAEEAIAICKKAIKKAPDDLIARIIFIQAYSLAGMQTEAQKEASEVLRINPNFSLESYEKRLGYKNKADTDKVIATLRAAGLK